ncbi:hypothetical protein [Streptomyces sp. NPDC006368]|uniref:hypothetical protein n=1 Tax=Streptomyces sp. NPDC006368 TaxID=3156760 RepID=UPI0033B898C1
MTTEELRNLIMRLLTTDPRFTEVGPHPFPRLDNPAGILVRVAPPVDRAFIIQVTVADERV